MESEATAGSPVPGSREARLDTRRAVGAKGDPKIASERGVQSFGSWQRSGDELARSSCSANNRDGPGANRLSKIECVLGTEMSQNASRERRLAYSESPLVLADRGRPPVGNGNFFL